MNHFCEYGCGRNAKYSPRKGMRKWCCEDHYNKCPAQIKLKSNILKKSKVLRGKNPWNKNITGQQVAWNKGRQWSKKTKLKMSLNSRLTIEKINCRYPLFSRIEEMRYNPDKPGEIQVHCKNHNCLNSKEKGGWFTPKYNQLYERIRAIEYFDNDINNFYCSIACKNTCPLYGTKATELLPKNNQSLYTQEEYQTFRDYVLKRDNYKCQYCGAKAEQVHHERPQKLEPFFVLDPDLAWSVCKKCHFKYGHKNECSTGKLAYTNCL